MGNPHPTAHSCIVIVVEACRQAPLPALSQPGAYTVAVDTGWVGTKYTGRPTSSETPPNCELNMHACMQGAEPGPTHRPDYTVDWTGLPT